MPKRRASKTSASGAPRDPDHRPEQADVERAIASVLDRLKPRIRNGQGAPETDPRAEDKEMPARKPRPAFDPER